MRRMHVQDFERLLKPDCYQVFLFACPANFPFSFAVHPWFVINKKGDVSRFAKGRGAANERWEVYYEKDKGGMTWGHVHKDWLPPFQGIEMFTFSRKFFWKSRLLGCIEGGEGSPAQKMVATIEKSGELYPARNTYALRGPNSNTYVQWVLNQFPDSGLSLPWNSIGKRYKMDKTA